VTVERLEAGVEKIKFRADPISIATAIAVRTHHLVPDVPPERLYNSSERPNRCVYCYISTEANLILLGFTLSNLIYLSHNFK